MPAIVKKSGHALVEIRREVLHAVSWQVRSSVWSPPTDFFETEDSYVVRVEVAGMREEDFEVTLQKDTLLITGERHENPARRAYHQMEIRFGKFASALPIPGPVDSESAQAVYENGFLTITLPKQKRPKK